MTTIPQTTARNATFEDLRDLLMRQHDVKLDAVVPANKIRSEGGLLKIEGMSLTSGDDELTIEDVLGGAKPTVATVRPTAIMDGQIATKLGIPVKYIRRLRAERPDLYDANVNGWLRGLQVPTPHESGDEWEMQVPPDQRSFLLRTFSDPQGGEGIGRAFLSDTYAPFDNLDALVATIQGINASGVRTEMISANLTETRMSMRFACPDIVAMAPTLLENYRSPVEGLGGDFLRWREVANREGLGYQAGSEPVVFGGFDVDNSETGGGAFTITPVLTVQVCKNGLKLNALAMRKIHLGGRLDQGVVEFTADTQRKNVELIAAQTKDTVATFVSPQFVRAQVEGIEAKAGAPVTDAQGTVELVSKKLAFTEDQMKGIFDHFIHGGQMTAGGVVNAITSYSQTVENPDTAYDLENAAMQALDLVAG